MLTAKP